MAQSVRKAKDLLQDRQGEELLLSTSVYFGLYALTKAHKPSIEFEKVFQKDLFLKSNVAALPHVLHFLFTIYDAEEFKKRFYWPLYNDREAEKTFRSACLKYLMELNEKFNLRMEDISTYVMLFPGGLKFLKIMEKLIKFVTLEELKRLGKDHLVESMTISQGNKELRKIAKHKDLLDNLAAEKMDFYTSEQQRIDETYQEYRRRNQPLAAKHGVSIDELLSEEFEVKQIERIKEKIDKINRQKDVLLRYNSTVEELQTKIESVEEPTISNQFIERTREATITILEHFPEIQREFSNNELTRNDKVNVDFVLRLMNACFPQMIGVLKEEIHQRTRSMQQDVETITAAAKDIEKMMDNLKVKEIPKLESLSNEDEGTEKNVTNTPNFKLDAQTGPNCIERSRLLFHDFGEAELTEMRMNQFRKRRNNTVRSASSFASSVSSMKTAKKPAGFGLVLATGKRTDAKKFKNFDYLSAQSTRRRNPDFLNMSSMSSPSPHCSKISIDGCMPLGSSSMIVNNREFDDSESTIMYKYSVTPASARVGTVTSPSGRFRAMSASDGKFTASGDIPEEDNSRLNSSLGDLMMEGTVTNFAGDCESLFNVSDGVLKDVE